MNAICGMTKVLKESPLAQEQRECVRIISSSAKALLSLLNNILDFSKIEAGKTEILVRRTPDKGGLHSSHMSFGVMCSLDDHLHKIAIYKQECPFDVRKCTLGLMQLMSNYTAKRTQKVTLATHVDSR
jgi:signal transduction histidine kinase